MKCCWRIGKCSIVEVEDPNAPTDSTPAVPSTKTDGGFTWPVVKSNEVPSFTYAAQHESQLDKNTNDSTGSTGQSTPATNDRVATTDVAAYAAAGTGDMGTVTADHAQAPAASGIAKQARSVLANTGASVWHLMVMAGMLALAGIRFITRSRRND